MGRPATPAAAAAAAEAAVVAPAAAAALAALVACHGQREGEFVHIMHLNLRQLHVERRDGRVSAHQALRIEVRL